MKKLLSVISLLGAILLNPNGLNANDRNYDQCNLKFEYKVEHTTNGNSNGKILLKLEEGEAPFTVHLLSYNNSGELVQTKEYKSFRGSDFQVVFKNLKSGDYLIRIDNEVCKLSLTGLDSIQIR